MRRIEEEEEEAVAKKPTGLWLSEQVLPSPLFFYLARIGVEAGEQFSAAKWVGEDLANCISDLAFFLPSASS